MTKQTALPSSSVMNEKKLKNQKIKAQVNFISSPVPDAVRQHRVMFLNAIWFVSGTR